MGRNLAVSPPFVLGQSTGVEAPRLSLVFRRDGELHVRLGSGPNTRQGGWPPVVGASRSRSMLAAELFFLISARDESRNADTTARRWSRRTMRDTSKPLPQPIWETRDSAHGQSATIWRRTCSRLRGEGLSRPAKSAGGVRICQCVDTSSRFGEDSKLPGKTVANAV